MSDYFNTTSQTGHKLKEYQDKAKTESDRILLYFQVAEEAGPSRVWKIVFNYKNPITSVRRAITNLTKGKSLEKTDKKVMGYYGREEHVWRLKG